MLARIAYAWRARRLPFVAVALLAAACAMTNPRYDPAKPHHTPTGFRNNYPHPPKASFWQWKWQQWRDNLPAKPAGGYRFPLAAIDVATLANPSITWIGHATLLLRVGGLNLLTDPQFSVRASPVQFAGPARVVPPALALADLPHVDAVLISHNHYDHLDEDSVRALAAQPGGPPVFYVGLGLKAWFAARGIDTVEEMDWWETRRLAGLAIHFVPSQHWSARTPWDTNETLWGGFVVEHPSLRFHFAGDTGYSRDFADIAARFGPIDLTALPIGAYAPRWFMQPQHVNPAEAVQIYRDLGARHAVAVHWGTFDDLTDESLYEPPQALARALVEQGLGAQDFWVLQHGETRSLDFLRSTAALAHSAD